MRQTDRKPAAFPGFVLAMLLAAFAAMLNPAQTHAENKWLSAHYADHPLAGTIWSSDLKPVTPEAFEASLLSARFVLLGEIHNNPDHHLLQAKLIKALTAEGRRPSVVFEMIPVSMQDKLDREIQSGKAEASKLGDVLQWKERGWPDWSMYQPIAEAALSANLPLLAGALDRDTQMAIARSKPTPLTEELGLSQPVKPEIAQELEREINEAHCGLLPPAAAKPMVKVQRARDAQLAKALLSANERDGAVLIAGSGHVRKDWAVPVFIQQKMPDASIVSVAFLEVTPEQTSPSDYIRAIAGFAKPFDFIYLTPRDDLTDHCAELKKHMEKKKSGGSGKK